MDILAKNENDKLQYDNKISVIILCCDEAADVSVTIRSLARFKDNIAECIVADAAGGLQRNEIEKLYEELQQISIKYCSLAENMYQNVAQLKNDAVKLTDNDRVLLVNSGESVCLEKITELAKVTEPSDVSKDSRAMLEKLLLSGRGVVRHIVVSRRMLGVVGGWNPNLDCGEDYELLLRVCDYCSDAGFVGGCSQNFPDCGFSVVFNEENEEIPIFREDYYTYAYAIAKYSERLREQKLFDEVFMNRYNEALDYGIDDYFTECSEVFMPKGSQYDKVDEATKAVLVFMEEGICNGALRRFAEAFTEALRRRGQNVYTYGIAGEEELRNVHELMAVAVAHRYKAAVEFQAGVFTTQLPSGELLGNILKCPKFMYEFDHPLYISWHFMLPIKDYYVLSQDETYTEYLREYFPNVKGAWHMPVAGESVNIITNNASREKTDTEGAEKRYGLTFVAAYNNYRQCLAAIRNMACQDKKIALGMLSILKNNPTSTAESALRTAAQKVNVNFDDKRTFVSTLHKMGDVVRAVTFYYREKVVRTLVDAGVQIHVFSDTWRKCPFANNENMVIHRDIPYEEGVEVIAQSKITLNVMSWHKGGMTERVANAMLNKTVCVTDKTTYIERHFCDGDDIVLFDLENIEVLPDRIKVLLSADGTAKCQVIAGAAYKKAVASYTWNEGAKTFMEILSKID